MNNGSIYWRLNKQYKLRYFYLLLNQSFISQLKSILMANLIQVTSYSKLANQEVSGTATNQILINVLNILSVSTRTTAYNTTGVTDILYSLPVNNATYQITLVVTEARSAILTAANANAVAT